MGLFGQRRDRGRDAEEFEDDFQDGHVEGSLDAELGPYDVDDAPEDDVPRLDFGSVRYPVPEGSQLQVELVDAAGTVKAVHVITSNGQLTVNAYAAPKSGGLWEEVCGELAEQLRGEGAAVRSEAGEWGQELTASLGQVALRFIGIDGPRWMLRGVVAGPPDLAKPGAAALRDVLRDTVVVRGAGPMPARTSLPIELPTSIAEHIAEAQPEGGMPG